MIELDHNALFFALKKEAFHSSILEMDLAGKTEKVLLRDFQMHAFKPIVHARGLPARRRVHQAAQEGAAALRRRRESSPAVKTDKCLVSHVRTELEIECLASQLPEFVTIDLSGLERNTSLHASDLKLPEGIKAVKRGTLNPVIVAVTTPKVEEEIVATGGRGCRQGQDQGQEDREAEPEVMHRPKGCARAPLGHHPLVVTLRPLAQGPFSWARRASIIPPHDSTLRRPGQPGP